MVLSNYNVKSLRENISFQLARGTWPGNESDECRVVAVAIAQFLDVNPP